MKPLFRRLIQQRLFRHSVIHIFWACILFILAQTTTTHIYRADPALVGNTVAFVAVPWKSLPDNGPDDDHSTVTDHATNLVAVRPLHSTPVVETAVVPLSYAQPLIRAPPNYLL